MNTKSLLSPVHWFSRDRHFVTTQLKRCSSSLSIAGPRQNQDRFYVNDDLGLYLVVDGMAGHNAGRLAARLTSEVLSTRLARLIRSSETLDCCKLETALNDALVEIRQMLVKTEQCNRMFSGLGCTFAIAIVSGNELFYTHIGDTRIYMLTRKLDQLTEDETVAHELSLRGMLREADEPESPWRHYLTNSLSSKGVKNPPQWEVRQLSSGDRVLLATNGLSDGWGPEEIRRMAGQGTVKESVSLIRDQGNRKDLQHNTTCILTEVSEIQA